MQPDTAADGEKSSPEAVMVKAKRWIGLLAFALLMSSCATFDDAKSSMKKSFPGRENAPATTDNNARK